MEISVYGCSDVQHAIVKFSVVVNAFIKLFILLSFHNCQCIFVISTLAVNSKFGSSSYCRCKLYRIQLHFRYEDVFNIGFIHFFKFFTFLA